MYGPKLFDHFRNPRNAGELAPPAVCAEVSNPACGDVIKLYARFDGDRVAEARYQVRGCTASIAAGSAVAGWIEGRTRVELAGLTPASVEAMLDGLPTQSKHAAVLAVDAVRAIIKA